MTQVAGTVLALRALGLGDALTGIPALRGLRRAFPEHRLVLAAPRHLGAWLVRLGVVDAVLPTVGLQPLEWPGDGPAVAVNLHGRGPQSHRLLLQTHPRRMLAFECAEGGHVQGPHWHADEHEVLRWCRLVRSVGGDCGPEDLRLAPVPHTLDDSVVVVHPGAASGSRRWPPTRWVQVARALAAEGHPVVVTGAADESPLCAQLAQAVPGALNTAGALDLDALTALVAEAALALCGDTGVAHLATACATPSVLLFGPTPPRRWGPLIDQPLHTVLWHGRPVSSPWGDPHSDVIDERLDAVTVEEVLDAARALLAPEELLHPPRAVRTSVPHPCGPAARAARAAGQLDDRDTGHGAGGHDGGAGRGHEGDATVAARCTTSSPPA